MDHIIRLDRELEDPGLPKGLDAVLLIRFYHDFWWMKTDRGAVNRAVFEALRPGGVYGIVDHQAESGSGERDIDKLHRIDAEFLKSEILAAGFVFDAASDTLANPHDGRDWYIYENDGARRDTTDRFVFRFRKPAAAR